MRAGHGFRVLTTDDVSGWNRAALATVRALAGSQYQPSVTVAGPVSLAASSRWCAEVVEVPKGGTPGYAQRLRERVAEGGYSALLPASDVALIALRDPAARLVDKASLASAVRDAGLQSLPGQVYPGLEELRAQAAALDFPAVVKSVVKSGVENLQAVRVDSPSDVHELSAAPGEVLVQPFLARPMRAISGVVWDDRFLAVCHQEYLRLWPSRAGVAAAAVTVDADPELEHAVLRLLRGHSGVFQVQLIDRFVLDVNPRVYGSMPLAVSAGANLPLLACDAALGKVPDAVTRSRPGMRYRWLEGDLRNAVAELRRGDAGFSEVMRRVLPQRRTVYSVESLRDPRPTWTRVRAVASARGKSR